MDKMTKLNLYFAYGSNTNLQQMENRCPNAELVGLAKLKGYKLAYRAGFLTVLKDARFKTTVAAWQITPDHEESLDVYEGYPKLYGKKTLQAKTGLFKKENGLIYTMQPPYNNCISMPSESYHSCCMQGYSDCGIDTEQLEMALYEVFKESHI